MSKIEIVNAPTGCSLFFLALWGYGLVSWIINLIQLLYCNFQGRGKTKSSILLDYSHRVRW